MSQPAFDFGDDEADDAANPTYSVGELADAINDTLRRGFSDGVWVRGEITGWSDRGQHAYFTLVDDADDTDSNGRGNGRGRAVVNVQFFANARMRLRPMLRKHRLRLGDGMKVRVFGYLDYYAPNGRIGLKMTGIDPRYTLGEIAQSRDEIIRRLVADGLLDANKQRPLSPIPLRVGVVTSVGTAAWHDFHDELQRCNLGFRLSVIDTRVQGESAEASITAAVVALSRRTDLDAIVLIRGGGARNELAVFDAESIARAIAVSPVPVLTGLGHEVDRSVADEVAHTTLKTPTACAGELIDRATRYCADTEATFAHIVRSASSVLDRATGELSDTAHRIARRTHAAVERADERLGMRLDMLSRAAPAALERAEVSLAARHGGLITRANSALERSSGRLDVIAARVGAVDPAVQLARGWSITRDADGRVVRSTGDVAPDDTVTIAVADGLIHSTVTRTVTSTNRTPP
ncbi:MAG TPA: exodeoxyribonuclease VII large subunit [Ilumatobacteraceae bacterium]|nr:exodeoxyribonuclease VII large subunit [Ilumatobacteraceae bacterium]